MSELNLRVVGCPVHGLRAIDLNGTEDMCGDCRVLGPDGKPLGWADGRPPEYVPEQVGR